MQNARQFAQQQARLSHNRAILYAVSRSVGVTCRCRSFFVFRRLTLEVNAKLGTPGRSEHEKERCPTRKVHLINLSQNGVFSVIIYFVSSEARVKKTDNEDVPTEMNGRKRTRGTAIRREPSPRSSGRVARTTPQKSSDWYVVVQCFHHRASIMTS